MKQETYGSLRCGATASSGEQCRRWAILGGSVCPTHGGSAPQVKAAARARLQELAHPAITRLADLMGSDNETVALRAAMFVIDRTHDEKGEALGMPMPSKAQLEAWIAELEEQLEREAANR